MTTTPIRFGITGPGMIAEFHAKAIAAIPGAELVAVHGRAPEKTRAFAERHGCEPYGEYVSFLTKSGLDVVTICTPSGAHLAPTFAAVQLGKHVICEKPLEVTVERVDAMIKEADKAGVILAGILPRRFNPATKLLRDAVTAGRFGHIAFADAYVKWWRTDAYYDSGAWRGTWELDGGGALMNQSIHTIDLLLHVMGDVKSVHARTTRRSHHNIEVEDTAVAMLEFESGALGVIQGSTACWSEQGHAAEIQITGDGGSVFMADDKFRVWQFRDALPEDAQIRADHGLTSATAGAGAADPKAIDFSWHQRNFEDVIAAIREGRQPSVTGQEARRAVALIRAIYESAEKGGVGVEVR